jgi:hypothetical protein
MTFQSEKVRGACADLLRSAAGWRHLKIYAILTTIALAMPPCARAANLFLDTPDARTVCRRRMGDNLQRKEAPLSASVVTRRTAQMNWGAVFELRFEQIRSRAKPPREIEPMYFVATDTQIYLLNEANNAEARAPAGASRSAATLRRCLRPQHLLMQLHAL